MEKKRSRMNLSIGQVVAKGSSIDLKQTRDAFYFKVSSDVLSYYYYSLMTLLYCACYNGRMDTEYKRYYDRSASPQKPVIESNTG